MIDQINVPDRRDVRADQGVIFGQAVGGDDLDDGRRGREDLGGQLRVRVDGDAAGGIDDVEQSTIPGNQGIGRQYSARLGKGAVNSVPLGVGQVGGHQRPLADGQGLAHQRKAGVMVVAGGVADLMQQHGQEIDALRRGSVTGQQGRAEKCAELCVIIRCAVDEPAGAGRVAVDLDQVAADAGKLAIVQIGERHRQPTRHQGIAKGR